MPRMLSGHLQGQLLRMLSLMIRPQRILEIGTYTGYSAICLSAGLQQGGTLDTIDVNDELAPMATRYFRHAGVDDRITLHTGNALEILPGLSGLFDIVFIDADKINYSQYYDLVFPKLRPGGYLIADNVLWSGKVTGRPEKMDADTRALHRFNEMVRNDPRVFHVLLPVRDGLMVARKTDEQT
jgi:caffeoyl-CoA O-methyltransferase